MAKELDLEALCPFDSSITDPRAIFQNNIEQICSCDGIVVNMNPFRGASVDDGTAFEAGLAYALGKPIVGYLSDLSSVHEKTQGHFLKQDKIKAIHVSEAVDPQYVFPDGMRAEPWDFPTNLMLHMAQQRLIHGGLHAALVALRGILYAKK
jgi:nucleoside 2-deoxyribosyltransferase